MDLFLAQLTAVLLPVTFLSMIVVVGVVLSVLLALALRTKVNK